ncbi:MAG: hypothetical protein WC563_15595 [Brevundimonas sp.]
MNDNCENCRDLQSTVCRMRNRIEELDKRLTESEAEAYKVPHLQRTVKDFESARSRSAELSMMREPSSEEIRLHAIIERALEVISAAKDGEPTPLVAIESVLLEAEP